MYTICFSNINFLKQQFQSEISCLEEGLNEFRPNHETGDTNVVNVSAQ